jgi:hypothetical protein
VAAQLQVLEAGAVAEGVVGEGQNVVGFVVREMDLQQVEAVVDRLNEAELPSKLVEGADPAVGDAAAAVGNLLVDVAGGEHGLKAAAAVAGVESAFDPALAVGQLVVDSRVHSKSLVATGVGKRDDSSTPRKRRRISSFSLISSADTRRTRLLKG